MRAKKSFVLLILPAVAACCWQVHTICAEDLELPPLPNAAAVVIPLEHDASQAPEPLPALPPLKHGATPQSLGGMIAPSAQSGMPDVGQLRNPFQWDNGPEDRKGLFGRLNTPRSGVVGSPATPRAGVAPYPGAGAGASASTPAGMARGTPPVPGAAAPGTVAPSSATPEAAAMSPEAAAAIAAASAEGGPGFGGGIGSSQETNPMIGDMSPYRLNSTNGRFTAFQTKGGAPGSTVPPPPPPGPRAAQLFYPSVRIFKVAENMSPRPQDRFFFSFHNFYDVNQTINKDFQVPVKNITASRYFFGFEKTFNDGNGSVGIRMPIDNLAGVSTLKGFRTPGSTSTGDLTVFTKYILEQNKQTGSLVSVGLAITPPTGPGRFAGAPWTFGLNSTYVQPFIGYIWNKGNFYIHGFSAFDFPISTNDVTLMYNDIGCGYYLIKSNDPTKFVTGLAPTFEVHVNSPLNHRRWYNPFDLAGTADSVNLTYGVNIELRRRAILSTALVTPLTSPQPFSAELAVMLNIFYGRTRNNRIAMTPPPVF